MWLPSQGNPDRFTDRAIEVLRVANHRAWARHHAHVAPEHVLWALATVERGPGRVTLERLGLDLAKSVGELEILPAVAPVDNDTMPGPSVEAEHLLKQAKAQAKAMGHDYVGTEHIVLGLLLCGPCPAANYLQDRGIGLDNFRESVLRLLAGQGS